jgi:glycerol-3-phosphate acyltransferase PlsY
MLAVMATPVTLTLVVTFGFLIGSVPVAVLRAAAVGLPDPRTIGDRNPGYWNMRERFGANVAAPVFVGDVAKGVVAAAGGALAAGDGQWWMAYVGGGAAMVGHAWPVFAGFRGGRSVLTFVGAGLVCAPVPAVLAIGVTGAVWAWRRDLAPAARLGIASFPILQLATEGPYRTAATGALMTFVGLRFLGLRFATARLERRRAR